MTNKQHLLISRPGFSEELAAELAARWAIEATLQDRFSLLVPASAPLPEIDDIVFARQLLPRVIELPCTSVAEVIAGVSDILKKATQRANRQTGRWTFHVFAADDNEAGKFALKLEKPLLRETVAKLPAFAKRFIDSGLMAVAPDKSDIVVQVFVPSAAKVWVSVSSLATGVLPFPGGTVRMKDIKGAPSRSARKLEEAWLALGRSPKRGESAVDLGAAPGGWSLCLALRGADVIAVDHAALSLKGVEKLPGTIEHLKENGLKYLPEKPVDWLCCDMVIPARDSVSVLATWLKADLMGAFIVNIKLPRERAWSSVAMTLDLLGKYRKSWARIRVKHLYHDRHEITVMGSKKL